MAANDLLKELAQRHDAELAELERLDAYYREGNHLALELPAQARRELSQILEQARTPWLKLTIDTPAERLIVDGFRTNDDERSDETVWRWWQDNKLDGRQMALYVETMKSGYAYCSVWPGDGGEDVSPIITPEPASNVFVAYDGIDPYQATSAIKIAGRVLWLYPDGDRVLRFEKVGVDTSAPRWEQVDEVENPLGVIPYVKFRANPTLLGGTRSDLEVGIPIQDRINRTTVDRLLAQAFSAFRQRWATGLVLDEDDDGNPIAPFKVAHDRLWTAEDSDVKFGEFSEATLSNYISAVESDVHHLAAITRTPAHYLLGQMVNLSAEALAAAETGLARRIAERQQTIGESWEETMRLAAQAADLELDSGIETIWRRTETVSEAQVVDAALKLSTLGIPQEALWERIGATPQQITRWRRQAQQDALRAALRAPLANAGAAAPTPPLEESEAA